MVPAGRVTAEKSVAAEHALEAAEALNDLNPHFLRGPGRKLGL